MKNKEIEKLLAKETLTAKEGGRVLLAYAAGELNHEPVCTFDELRAVDRKVCQQERKEYNKYCDIYDFIVAYNDHMKDFIHQFFNGYYHAQSELTSLYEMDEAERMATDIPLLMTESQYQKLLEISRKQFSRLTQADKIGIALGCVASTAEIQNKAVGEALTGCKGTPATESYYLKCWNAESLMLNKAIDEERLKDDRFIDILLKAGFWFWDEEETVDIPARYKELTGKELDYTQSQRYKELERFVEVQANPSKLRNTKIARLLYGIETEADKKPPKDLTLFDMLPYYINAFKDNPKKAEKILNTDIPQLYAALLEYIDTPEFKTSREVLALSIEEVSFKKRVRSRGIAIVQDVKRDELNESGGYGVKYTSKKFRCMYSEGHDIQGLIDFRENSFDIMEEAANYLNACDFIFSKIGEICQVSELKNLNYSHHPFTKYLKSRYEEFNLQLYITFGNTQGDDNEKLYKRTTIKWAFMPLTDDRMTLSKPKLKKLEAYLANHILNAERTLTYKDFLKRFKEIVKEFDDE